MSTFWSLFIIVLVVVNIGGCVWLLVWTMNMRTADEDDQSTGHVWDGDLTEYNNPLPRWWLYTFYLSIAFTVIYLALYPGLGNFGGLLGWTQEQQYEEQIERSNERYERVYAQFRDQDIDELASNPDALRIGRNVFMNFCAACHGSDARGARSFPNLTDDEWLYGGDATAVRLSVANGRIGNMPGLGAVTGEEGAERIIDYMLSEEGDSSPEVAAGKQAYLSSGCMGCHGANAEGNRFLGAPNLRDDVWLHGSDRATLKDVIMNGRVNEMPPHKDILGEDRVRLVSAYVLSLSRD